MLTLVKAQHKSENGFTMIELIVVMAIMALLAAAAVGASSNIRGNAFEAILNPTAKNIESWLVANPSNQLMGTGDFVTGSEFATLASSANKGLNVPSEISDSNGNYKLKTFGSHGQDYELCIHYSDNPDSRYADIYVYDSVSGEIAIAEASQC